MDMLLPDPAALPFLGDLKWLGKVRNAARIRFRDERFDLSGCRAKVRALIEEHIAGGGVDQLLPPVSILAPEFEEEIRKLGSNEARASEMERTRSSTRAFVSVSQRSSRIDGRPASTLPSSYDCLGRLWGN
jgi:hypothetical protein